MLFSISVGFVSELMKTHDCSLEFSYGNVNVTTISVTLYNTGALLSINSCLTNAQIILK